MNSRHWDIFCTVIDNLGDIGTCWRLAHILHHDHGQRVRLCVDDLDALKALVPATQNMAQQTLHGIEVHHWTSNFPDIAPAHVVVETFGCTLPASYVQAMLRSPQPVWINLEYMSCEDWVCNIHGQTSLLANGLRKHFIIPSLLSHSGGLLREENLLTQRDAFLASSAQQQTWCATWHIPLPQKDSLKISFFAYENPKLGALLASLSRAPQAVTAYIPVSRLLNSLREYLHILKCRSGLAREKPVHEDFAGKPAPTTPPEFIPTQSLNAGDTYQLGNLTLHIIPFLPQAEYDRLLWLCDINFVRGEESLTRAIFTGKPFIWHIYPTEDAAHHDKLNAFLATYTEHDHAEHLTQLCAWTQHWNGITYHTTDAYTLLNTLHQQHTWYAARSSALAQIPDLSQNLLSVAFHTPTG